jgi:septal ring factor EnvC (AmiA/AmiB activator)
MPRNYQRNKMKAKGYTSPLVIIFCLIALAGCEKKPLVQSDFTKADSLTETYLALQDSMLQAWNTMIADDNRKIKAMKHLLVELNESSPEKRDELTTYEERLNDLLSMRYDQHSMSNTETVSEYDFASNSLVTELVSMAEAQKEFAYNTDLQKLVDSIRAADQRVANYREEYDAIAMRFNRFIERNKEMLQEIEDDSFLEKKPLFQMAAE